MLLAEVYVLQKIADTKANKHTCHYYECSELVSKRVQKHTQNMITVWFTYKELKRTSLQSTYENKFETLSLYR